MLNLLIFIVWCICVYSLFVVLTMAYGGIIGPSVYRMMGYTKQFLVSNTERGFLIVLSIIIEVALFNLLLDAT